MESFPYVIARTLDEIGVVGGRGDLVALPQSVLRRSARNDRCAGAAPPDPQTVLSPLAGDSRSEGDSTLTSISDAIGVSTQSDLSLEGEDGGEP